MRVSQVIYIYIYIHALLPPLIAKFILNIFSKKKKNLLNFEFFCFCFFPPGIAADLKEEEEAKRYSLSSHDFDSKDFRSRSLDFRSKSRASLDFRSKSKSISEVSHNTAITTPSHLRGRTGIDPKLSLASRSPKSDSGIGGKYRRKSSRGDKDSKQKLKSPRSPRSPRTPRSSSIKNIIELMNQPVPLKNKRNENEIELAGKVNVPILKKILVNHVTTKLSPRKQSEGSEKIAKKNNPKPNLTISMEKEEEAQRAETLKRVNKPNSPK